MKLIAATALIAAAVLLIQPPGSTSRSAFAAAIPGVDEPKTLSWTTTYYSRVTSADGKRTWIKPERRLHSYRHSGHYRETMLDAAGQPYAVEITDVHAARTLVLNVKEKKAVLKAPTQHYDARGPFAWVGEAIRDRMVAKTLPVKSVSMQGKKEIDKIQANVVRAMIDEGNAQGLMRRDFLFDESTRRLVGIWLPNSKSFDIETAVDRNTPAEEKWSSEMPVGYWEHEIVLDPSLDAKEFSLDTPAGYVLEQGVKATVTEAEMVTYLSAAVRFNDRIFPDSPYTAFDSAKFNTACQRPEADQSPAEKEMIVQHDKFLSREIYRSPVQQFVDDHTLPGSFHYVGAGVKSGDAKQIVCWFIPKNAAKPRAVFADLSIRDVAASELPFDLPN